MANIDEQLKQVIRLHIADELEPSPHERGKYVCPLCGSGSHGAGSTAAFSIDPADGVHGKCFACGFYGDVFDLVAKRDGLSSGEAMRALADKYEPGAELLSYRPKKAPSKTEAPRRDSAPSASASQADSASRRPSEAAKASEQQAAKSDKIADYIRRAHSQLPDSDGERYLKERGLTLETLERFRVGFDPGCYNKQLRRRLPSVVIAYPDAAYYITRPISEKAYDKPKAEDAGSEPIFNARVLWGDADAVFVVESQLCALSVEQCGGAAIALGGAGENRLLKLLKEKPTRATLVLALDNDDPGKKAQAHLEASLKAMEVSCVPGYISGSCKDPNELLVKDAEQFRQSVSEWQECASELAREQQDKTEAQQDKTVAEQREAKREKYLAESNARYIDEFFKTVAERPAAIPTGFTTLDELLDGGLFPGLYILGAITSLGKSTFALQMADNIAASAHDVIFVALEMSRTELIAKSLSRLTWQIPTDSGLSADVVRSRAKTVRGILSGRQWDMAETELVEKATATYKTGIASRMWIHEGTGDIGVADVAKRVKEHIRLTGRKPVLFVDYVQILAPADVRASDKQNTDKAVLELKRLSRDMGIPVVCISSLNRENYTQPINLTAFKESGAIEYGSDVLMGLQFEGMDGEPGKMDKDPAKTVRNLVKDEKAKGNKGEAENLQLKILKNRNGRSGTDMKLAYYPMFNVYRDGGVKVDSSERNETEPVRL